jgi:hypothetical protein
MGINPSHIVQKPGEIATNTATVSFIDHELCMQAKVRVQQKRAKFAKSFMVRNFCRVQRPGALTFFIATRGFIRQTSIERNPRVISFNDFMEPEVHVEDALSNNAKVVSSTSPILSDLIFRLHFKIGY